MINLPLPRLDKNPELRNCLLKYARLQEGEVWDDPLGKHRIVLPRRGKSNEKLIRRTSPNKSFLRRISVTSVSLGGRVFYEDSPSKTNDMQATTLFSVILEGTSLSLGTVPSAREDSYRMTVDGEFATT